VIVTEKVKYPVREQQADLVVHEHAARGGLPRRGIDRDDDVAEYRWLNVAAALVAAPVPPPRRHETRDYNPASGDAEGKDVGRLILLPIARVETAHFIIIYQRDTELRLDAEEREQSHRIAAHLGGTDAATAATRHDFGWH
jgi:hypothetical protein